MTTLPQSLTAIVTSKGEKKKKNEANSKEKKSAVP